MKIKITVVDNDGNSHEGEFELEKNQKSNSKQTVTKSEKKFLIKTGSTTDKISTLIDAEFFDTNRTISDIVNELKSHDFHFKSTDLTLPLRNLVRNNMLKKTKELPNNRLSKYWTYVSRNGI